MERQEIVEIFRNHGIDIRENDASPRLAEALSSESPDTLWPLLEDFTHGKPIGMDCPNELMHSLTLRGALVKAFEENRDTITQEHIDAAREKYAKTANILRKNGATRTDDPVRETVEDENGELVAKPQKRKRDTTLMPLIERLVQEHAQKPNEDILSMVMEKRPAAKENTVRAYISKARGNLGLKSKGAKRGRANSGIYDKIKTLIQDNPETPRKEMIERIVNELDAKEGTAQAYYSKAKKELGL